MAVVSFSRKNTDATLLSVPAPIINTQPNTKNSSALNTEKAGVHRHIDEVKKRLMSAKALGDKLTTARNRPPAAFARPACSKARRKTLTHPRCLDLGV